MTVHVSPAPGALTDLGCDGVSVFASRASASPIIVKARSTARRNMGSHLVMGELLACSEFRDLLGGALDVV
jgi:hypothetical protein